MRREHNPYITNTWVNANESPPLAFARCLRRFGLTALDLNGVCPPVPTKNGIDPVIDAALPFVDILHLNEEELHILLPGEGTVASKSQRLLTAGVAVVAVTMGPSGCFISCGTLSRFLSSPTLPQSWSAQSCRREAPPVPLEYLNANGGGDAFLAGLVLSTMIRSPQGGSPLNSPQSSQRKEKTTPFR